MFKGEKNAKEEKEAALDTAAGKQGEGSSTSKEDDHGKEEKE